MNMTPNLYCSMKVVNYLEDAHAEPDLGALEEREREVGHVREGCVHAEREGDADTSADVELLHRQVQIHAHPAEAL